MIRDYNICSKCVGDSIQECIICDESFCINCLMEHSHSLTISDPEHLLSPMHPGSLTVGDLVLCRAQEAKYMSNISCSLYDAVQTINYVKEMIGDRGLGEVTGVWKNFDENKLGVIIEILYQNNDSNIDPSAWFIFIDGRLHLFVWLDGIQIIRKFSECIVA